MASRSMIKESYLYILCGTVLVLFWYLGILWPVIGWTRNWIIQPIWDFLCAYWPYGDAALLIASVGYVGLFLVKAGGKHGLALFGDPFMLIEIVAYLMILGMCLLLTSDLLYRHITTATTD